MKLKVIKGDSIKKSTPFPCFSGRGSTASRPSRSLVKDVQGFGKFSQKHFKLRKRTKLTLLSLIKV